MGHSLVVDDEFQRNAQQRLVTVSASIDQSVSAFAGEWLFRLLAQ